MLRSTFRCKGVGPSRERELWSRGYTTWDELPREGLILSPLLDERIREEVETKRALFEKRDLAGLAARLTPGEHWRLWPAFADEACFLDIETDGFTNKVTSVAIYGKEGPSAFVRGVNLDDLPAALERYGMVITFNGAAFDLPILRQAFPGLRVPPVHIDLRFLLRRLGERGGLKAIETRLGLRRPGEVEGVDGWEAVRLWRRWESRRDLPSLMRLVEYNVYDTIQLEPLLDLGYNRLVEHAGLPLPRREVAPADGATRAQVSLLLEELRGRLGL